MIHFEVAPEVNVVSDRIQTKKVPRARVALEELFVLLEDYGPAWYTQEHHDRALGALLERED